MIRPKLWTGSPDLRMWREDYLFSIGASSWAIHLGVVLLSGFILFTGTGQVWVLLWAAAMIAATMVLAALSLFYRRQMGGNPVIARRFGYAHSLVTALIGTCWGVGALAVASRAPDYLMFYSLVLGGTALGAVSSQHALPRSCLLSVWTSIPPLCLAHVLDAPGPRGMATGGMMLLFGMVLTILTIRIHSFLAQNVSLLHALDGKVEELEIARRAADEANAAKSRLLAQASHDLRQPVHAIGLLIEYLRHDETDAERLSVIARIDRSLDGLGRLFRSLLDVAALDIGRIKPNPAPFPLGPLLAEIVRQSTEMAREADIRLHFVPTSLWVMGDAALIQTMVQNLVGNAIKYAPGQRVLLGCRRSGDVVRIEVHDTGPGIPPDLQTAIFDEFFRLQPAGRSRAEGLGLGLSIVRRLARLTGAEVGLRSTPGRGSVFFLDCLPRRVPEELPRQAHIDQAGLDLLQGFRVLVIDDDETVRTSMGAMLERWGCEASIHATIPERFVGHDFVLMDQMLGAGVTGIAALETLSDGDASKLPPIAIVTGALEPELEDRAKAMGIAVLAKPVRPAQLRSLLLGAARNQTNPASTAAAAAALREPTPSVRSTAET